MECGFRHSVGRKAGVRSNIPDEIASRVSLLEVFCEAWNQGRGRTVDRDVLVQSGALTARFLDNVAAIAGELDAIRTGSARRSSQGMTPA